MKVRSSVRIGDLVIVMGMVGRDENGALVEGVVPQTAQAVARIESVLAEHGCDLSSLVRLRVYLTDIKDWPAVSDEISRALGETWPPTIALEVSALVEPSMKVELEADAIAT